MQDNYVDLEKAEERGLVPWDDYCPECGYTILNDETMEPFILCLGCGATTAESEED